MITCPWFRFIYLFVTWIYSTDVVTMYSRTFHLYDQHYGWQKLGFPWNPKLVQCTWGSFILTKYKPDQKAVLLIKMQNVVQNIWVHESVLHVSRAISNNMFKKFSVLTRQKPRYKTTRLYFTTSIKDHERTSYKVILLTIILWNGWHISKLTYRYHVKSR